MNEGCLGSGLGTAFGVMRALVILMEFGVLRPGEAKFMILNP